MSIDYKSIGRRIKAARTRLDMTQERLAEQVNLSPAISVILRPALQK